MGLHIMVMWVPHQIHKLYCGLAQIGHHGARGESFSCLVAFGPLEHDQEQQLLGVTCGLTVK